MEQGGLCLLGCMPPAVPARPAGSPPGSSLAEKRRGVLPVPLVHTDSSWEQNRERSLGRHEYLLLRAGLPAGSRKSRGFPKLQTYLALWASQPCVITKGFLSCRIRQWLQTLPSIL